jgi:hypothetical protein
VGGKFSIKTNKQKKLIGIHLKPLIHLAFSASMLHIQPFRNFCAKKMGKGKIKFKLKFVFARKKVCLPPSHKL